ncbi:MAG: hypothetical protein ACR2JY_00160 [Chloroflexota bacterium]
MVAPHRARLSMDDDPQLRRRLKMVAAAHDQTITQYVERALQRALAEDELQAGWSQLSAPAFNRDWNSDEDAVYDQLSAG